MRMRRTIAAWALVSAVLWAGAAAAHDTWLLPERFALPAGKTIVCELTSGMRFPRLESTIERDRVTRADVRQAGATTALAKRRSETRALAFLVPLGVPGVATVAVELKARALELTAPQVAEYLTEIGASESVRQAWRAAGGKRWHETYTKHAKTFVRVGDEADRGWAEPSGLAFELVPDADPTTLTAGQSLAVRLLRDGKPLPGLAVGLVRGGEPQGELKTTDADGRVVFHFAKRGRYLLRATDLRPDPQGPEGEAWSSDFTTLSLEVR